MGGAKVFWAISVSDAVVHNMHTILHINVHNALKRLKKVNNYFQISCHQYLFYSNTYLSFLLVEIVNNDTDEKIEGEEGAKNDEHNKIKVHVEVDFSDRLFLHLKKESKSVFYSNMFITYCKLWKHKETLTPLESTAAYIISIHPLNVAYNKIKYYVTLLCECSIVWWTTDFDYLKTTLQTQVN